MNAGKKTKRLAFLVALIAARTAVGAVLVFSGFVKAADPIGTQYKLREYAEALGLAWLFPDLVTLVAAVLLAMAEFCCGVWLVLAVNRRLTARLAAAFLVFMTALSVWIYAADPVSDCGCFGDAVKLTNGETLAKNIILTLLIIPLALRPAAAPRIFGPKAQWAVRRYSALGILAVAAYSLYYLPLLDFSPYRVGANIREGVRIPDGAARPVYETTFIMEKNGERREFSLADYPDSTWTFVDKKTTLVKPGYEPPIQDFSITLAAAPLHSECSANSGDREMWSGAAVGDDITDMVLNDTGYVFLLVSPHLEEADDSYFGDINRLYDYAAARGCAFLCITASGNEAISRWADMTGAEYPFGNTDETALKTMIRSNPGLLLLHDGEVIGKWSHNALPENPLPDSPATKRDNHQTNV